MGYDSVAHLIEETKSADAVAGRPMPWAIAASFITGLVYILTITVCIQVSKLPPSSSNPQDPPRQYKCHALALTALTQLQLGMA